MLAMEKCQQGRYKVVNNQTELNSTLVEQIIMAPWWLEKCIRNTEFYTFPLEEMNVVLRIMKFLW